MSVLKPLDKLPALNKATILLVSTEDAVLQQLAESMLREDCASQLLVHLATSLPLPSNVTRPRIDLIVFVVNLHSKYRNGGFRCLEYKVLTSALYPIPGLTTSLQNVMESLRHVDASFFLGKVCFLATGAGQESHCSIHRNTILKLAHTYRSPLLFCDLKSEDFKVAIAQRLLRMLQICAGHIPGVSSLNLLSLLQRSETPTLEDPPTLEDL